MKSKVTGEEKHYQKLNNKLHEEKYKLATEIKLLKDQLKLTTEENEFLKSKVVNLTDEEVRQLVQSSKRLEHLTSMTSILLGSMTPRYL